jgi:hypothetical protein
MTWGQRRELAARLRVLPLERVLPLCGGRPDPDDRHKWHTPAGTLSVTGAKFMNWSQGAGGGGAIDLVIQLHGLDFNAALDWLADRFADALCPEPVACLPPPAVPLRLPPPASGLLARVLHYLAGQRRLPPALLDPLLAEGTLYADARANAVFVLRDGQNRPVGAELRGTTAACWHGLVPGSQRDLGCFAMPAELRSLGVPADRQGRQVVLCESAIDAISCFALHPGYRCLSTAGARPNPRWLQALLDQGWLVYCGFDADPTGDAMARAMLACHPAVQRLRPCQHDWNDVLRAQA